MSRLEEKIKAVQEDLAEQDLEGWLLYDFHRNNSLAHTFLEIPLDQLVTRRFFYWIPQKGMPIKIVPLIEPYTLDHLPGVKWFYRGWQDLDKSLSSLASDHTRIAMEYSPLNTLPGLSKVDAGTVDLLRKIGLEVVSSADLLQKYTCLWTDEQVVMHFAAATTLNEVAVRTWSFIEQALRNNTPIDEYKVQQYMLEEISKEGCFTQDPPICAVNFHSANPHYLPQPESSLPICAGDFILIDLWCKERKPHAIYADITRVGVAASQPTPKQLEIFQIVKEARDIATCYIKEHYQRGELLQGWQVDQECREVVQKAGYGEFFIHRTGHNIGEDVHGPGANLDNLETRDFRNLLPGTGFSIEPGIYLPQEFGVRLEYDVYLDPQGDVVITGGIQDDLIVMDV